MNSVLPSTPRIGYIFNQCKKMGLWEPFEKNESSISFTLNGRRLYFKNSNNYKLFRELYIIFKKAGLDVNELLDSMPNVIKLKENINMNKKLIRLTESDLRNIVRKSVNIVLREGEFDGIDGEDEFDDIDVDGLYNSLKTYNENPVDIKRDIDYEPSDEDLMALDGQFNFDDTDFSDLMSGQYTESKNRIGRIIRESIRKVLKEDAKAVDPDNAVPQEIAEKLGFKREYSDNATGLEIWGRDTNNPNKYLSYLGIRRFTTWSKSPIGYVHIRITVKPSAAAPSAQTWGDKKAKRIGDYVDTGWADNDGAIFRNPKSGHIKRLKRF